VGPSQNKLVPKVDLEGAYFYNTLPYMKHWHKIYFLKIPMKTSLYYGEKKGKLLVGNSHFSFLNASPPLADEKFIPFDTNVCST
jgi:hypothetical protein